MQEKPQRRDDGNIQERDIDALVKNFRNKQDTLLNTTLTKEYGFINPTQETPVETSQVLQYLDLSWADPILQKLFPRFQWIKDRLYPRVKLMMFQKLRPDLRKVAETYRVIQTDSKIARNLGFDPEDLPRYETIRHFINDLLDEDTIKQLFYQQVTTIDHELQRYGEKLGEKTVEDAIIITAKRDDPDAEYNGYYKDCGWKKDLVLDQKHKVFLSYQDLGINEDEELALSKNLELLKQINIHIKETTVDGGYPSYKNIAIAKHQFGTNLFYKPQEHWVHNPLGDVESINDRYQQYWKHHEFNIYADLECKLSFLYQQGDYEWVGAYYRNQQVHTYNRRIKHCTRRYRIKRNTNESFNSYLKQHMGFETSLPQKGKYQAFKHTTLCLIAINAVALTRLQNGITTHLTSVAYLT
jgi:hypothetical protein